MAKRKTKTTKKTKQVDELKAAKAIVKKLIDLLKIETEVEVSENEQGAILVQLESDDPGVLIGYHGETLTSMQLVLGMMLYRKVGEWNRILVNVGDYRQRRQESLEKMALSAAQKAKFSGEKQALPVMPSSERRIIHLALADDQEVETESEGEIPSRRVVVRPKS